MSHRTKFEHDSNIGTYSILTNSYFIAAVGNYERFNSDIETRLRRRIPVIYTSIANCRVIGHLAVGNSKGLLVPDTITDMEQQYLHENLPDAVKIKCVADRFSALGNVIACNDTVALIHPDLDQETEECIADTLGVEVFRQSIADNNLIGTHIRFNNRGCMVSPKTSEDVQEELSTLLQLPIKTGTVNYGSGRIGLGVVVNDLIAFVGWRTTYLELTEIDSALKLDRPYPYGWPY